MVHVFPYIIVAIAMNNNIIFTTVLDDELWSVDDTYLSNNDLYDTEAYDNEL